MNGMTLTRAAELGRAASAYQRLRADHPLLPAQLLHCYMRSDSGLSVVQFACETQRGHRWVFTEDAYGGDDEAYLGEGRSYCSRCGADGDA
jgi:hypothetical protein